MQKIYKISNRKLKKPNPKNETTMEKQYREEQMRIERKKKYLNELNDFRTKLYIGDKNEKREVLKGIQREMQNFKNEKEIRNQILKNKERMLEIKNIKFHKRLEEKEKNQIFEKKNKFKKMNLENVDLVKQKNKNQYQNKVNEIAKDKRILDYSKRHYKRNFL